VEVFSWKGYFHYYKHGFVVFKIDDFVKSWFMPQAAAYE
jgi:hypothetical protein